MGHDRGRVAAKRNPTTLWARSDDVADEINERHVNSRYLRGVRAPAEPSRPADLEEAVAGGAADRGGAVARVPRCAEAAAPHPAWIPVVSLTKGFERVRTCG